jgi:hypothetical protein
LPYLFDWLLILTLSCPLGFFSNPRPFLSGFFFPSRLVISHGQTKRKSEKGKNKKQSSFLGVIFFLNLFFSSDIVVVVVAILRMMISLVVVFLGKPIGQALNNSFDGVFVCLFAKGVLIEES